MGFFSWKEKSPALGEQQQQEDPKAQALFNRKPTLQTSSSKNPYASQPPNPYNASAPPKSNQQGGYSQNSVYSGSAPSSNPKAAYSGASNGCSSTPDTNASALFGNRTANPNGPPPSAYGRETSNPPPAYSSASNTYNRPPPSSQNTYNSPASADDAYSTGASRQLTAEEEEEEDVESIKQDIRFTKQESVSSSRNALRVAAQAEETGRNTTMAENAEARIKPITTLSTAVQNRSTCIWGRAMCVSSLKAPWSPVSTAWTTYAKLFKPPLSI